MPTEKSGWITKDFSTNRAEKMTADFGGIKEIAFDSSGHCE